MAVLRDDKGLFLKGTDAGPGAKRHRNIDDYTYEELRRLGKPFDAFEANEIEARTRTIALRAGIDEEEAVREVFGDWLEIQREARTALVRILRLKASDFCQTA